MADRLRLSLTVSGIARLGGGDPARVVELARQAEDVGLDQIVLPDHLAIGPRTDRYPYGRFPLPADEPWLEPLTTLAAMAARTERIRLGTGVLLAPLRPALLLAKTVATLDVLSRGRLDLGVGIGWQREEFDASGVPFRGRAARLDDTLRACRALWQTTPASFQAPSVSFDALRALPQPVQPGGIPLWFGLAATPAHAARIAAFGGGWLPITTEPAELAAGIARLRQAFAAAGRDPDTLEVRAHVPPGRDARGRVDLDATLARIPELRALGVTVVAFALAYFVTGPDAIPGFLARVARVPR